jgi:hypothetical protein
MGAMPAEKGDAQKADMSKRILYSLSTLWDPASEDIFASGFTLQARNNWLESIKELTVYFNKTKSKLMSSSYVIFFNNYIQELEQASIDLFNAMQVILNSQIRRGTVEEADLVLLKTEYEKLKAHATRQQEMRKKLESKIFTDLKSTKKIKQAFLKVLQPFEKMYKKVLDEMGTMRGVVRLKLDVENSRTAARVSA